MNDTLCKIIGVKDTFEFVPCARIGNTENPATPDDFGALVGKALESDRVKVFANNKTVSRIAVCSGSGGSVLRDAYLAGADTLLTGEVKYNNELDAAEYGINLIITVKDTGIGMSKENVEKLFEKFTQADMGRTRKKGGVGLGLAIAQAIVNKMGGFITVKSELGKGSEFQFVVPQKIVDERPMIAVRNKEKINKRRSCNSSQNSNNQKSTN